jgi:phosphoribosylformylglycinamidine (FGAM) synthase-like amidotransferase family enzyme
MDKEKVVMAMLEKVNNDTRALGVQNGIDLMTIEQQVMQNHGSLILLLSNLHDFIVEKGLFKDPS